VVEACGNLTRVKWIKDIGKEEGKIVGNKAANLGELASAKIAIPKGFCITMESFRQFLKQPTVKKKIAHLMALLNDRDSDSIRPTSETTTFHF
jgi:pyruvate,water dikinase